MRRVNEFVGQDLKWEQPDGLKMEYELHGQGERIATLRFRSSLGSFATAECADGCWTFKRVGFFQTRVTIRLCGSDVEIATFKNNTWSGGGTLELADGHTFRANTNFWQTRYQFEDERGDPAVRFKHGGVIHASSLVEIVPDAAALPELPLLVILGWYLIILLRSDSAAVVV